MAFVDERLKIQAATTAKRIDICPVDEAEKIWIDSRLYCLRCMMTILLSKSGSVSLSPGVH
jgi:hypothetical protein